MKKSIIISEDTHNLIKEYCNNNSLKINDWIDKLLKEYMDKLIETKDKMV